MPSACPVFPLLPIRPVSEGDDEWYGDSGGEGETRCVEGTERGIKKEVVLFPPLSIIN